MSAHVVRGHLTTHVTLRVGMMVAQFHINREGLIPPAYISDNNGYGSKYMVRKLESFPAALLPEVTRLVRLYQTQHILKGDT